MVQLRIGKSKLFFTEPLRSIFVEIKQEHPFVIDAIVVLPDHLHCLWTLRAGDVDYSMRWGAIQKSTNRTSSITHLPSTDELAKNKPLIN
ncbi:MAG: hypothetical protein U9R57_14255 [Thermodesulfobacteriota bacterium]|nr:hypothetical protein [Thermodesulfobacteriota bacterium]